MSLQHLTALFSTTVFYKLKSAKNYDQLVFDTPTLSVFDCKREIMIAKKMGKGMSVHCCCCRSARG